MSNAPSTTNVGVSARLAGMMFLQFFIWGAWYVTVGNFIFAVGWDGGVIGSVYSVGPIAGMISPFFLGVIADRFLSTERVLAVMHLLGGAVMLYVPVTASGESPDSSPFVWALFVYMLFYMPT
ncbi:MAG: MFS transporter, partial [Planctomycetota bacterium]|nr:MFS transporter [Planctomycetota bacterium]